MKWHYTFLSIYFKMFFFLILLDEPFRNRMQKNFLLYLEKLIQHTSLNMAPVVYQSEMALHIYFPHFYFITVKPVTRDPCPGRPPSHIRPLLHVPTLHFQ